LAPPTAQMSPKDQGPKTMCSDYITTLLGVQPADLSELLKIVEGKRVLK